MAATAEMLMAPVGALTVELLLELRTLVSGAQTAAAVADEYVAVGVAKAATVAATWASSTRQDDAAIAWATHRALMDRAQQILAQAMSANAADEGGESYSTTQAVELQKQAATWLAAFEALEAEEEQAAADAVVLPTGSRTVVNRVVW